jgi:hypothetical protein
MNRATRKLIGATRIIHLCCSMLGAGVLIFFAATGFMLNNESMFDLDAADDNTVEMTLPAELVRGGEQDKIVSHLRDTCGVTGLLDDFAIDADTIELTFKRPGGRADITISRPGGEMEIMTEPGTLATMLVDLHKGSSAGGIWGWLIDVAAGCLLVACLSGIVLWLAVPKRRMLGLVALLIGLLGWCAAYFFYVPK